VAELTKSGKYKKNKDGSIKAHHRFIYRLNLHLLYKILCLTGCRVGEARGLKYKDVELVKLEQRYASYVPHVLKLEVREYKAMRKDYGTRQVIAPPHLKKHIDRVRLQNPHNKDDDLLINARGKQHSVYRLFRNVLDDASEWWLKNKGEKIDLRKSSEGATLTLHHLRSYFITAALLDRKLTPATVAVQVGQSLTTTQQYYLARKPREVSMYQLGGHDVPTELLTRTYASSYE
jgi:integrase